MIGKSENGKLRDRRESSSGALERFSGARGARRAGRPAWEVKSESQGWEVENKWNQAPQQSGPAWVSPDPRAMPAGSEIMYLAARGPVAQNRCRLDRALCESRGRESKR